MSRPTNAPPGSAAGDSPGDSPAIAEREHHGPWIGDRRGQLRLYLEAARRGTADLSSAAILAFDNALALEPTNDELLAELAAGHQAGEDWEALIPPCFRLLAAASSSTERLPRALELAERVSASLGERPVLPALIDIWEDVLEWEPDHARALEELQLLYHRCRRWDRLAALYARRASLEPPGHGRVPYLARAAALYADQLGDDERAIDSWQELIAIQPDHRGAIQALTRLYVGRGAWRELEELFAAQGRLDELVSLLEHHLHEHESIRALLWYRIGVIWRDRLECPDDAVRAFENALAFPDAGSAAAAAALVPVYEQQSQPRKLARALEIQLACAVDGPTSFELASRLAAIQERTLDAPGAAFSAWLRAFERDWRSPTIRFELERLAATAGCWQRLVDAYELVCERIEQEPPAVQASMLPLLVEAVRVLGAEPDQSERAQRVLERALRVQESVPSVLYSLEQMCREHGSAAELLRLYERRLASATDDAARMRILVLIAELPHEALGDDERAVAACQALVAMQPGHPRALDRLEALYHRLGAWHELAEVLEQRLSLPGHDSSDTSARAARALRLGEVLEDHQGRAGEALRWYAEALALEPAGATLARWRMERFLYDPAHAEAAAAALVPVYRVAGDHARLVAVYEVLAAHSTGATLVDVLCQMAATQEQHLRCPGDALATLARALQVDPSAAVAFDQLERLASACGSWEALADIYRTVAAQRLSLEQQVEVRCRLGRIYKDHLREPDRAIATFHRVLDLSPKCDDALAALEELYTRAGRWGDLVELVHGRGLWDRLVAILESYAPVAPAERAAAYREIAELCEEQLGETQRAIDVCRRAIDVEPMSIPVLRLLEQLYERTGQHGEQLDILELELDAVASEERVEVLLRMADLCELGVGDLERAAECVENALLIDSDQPDCTIRLEGYYRRMERWEPLLECYRRRFDVEDDLPTRAELCRAMAELYREHGEDPMMAAGAYEELVAAAPELLGAVVELARLYQDMEQVERAAELFCRAGESYVGRGDHDGALAMFRAALAVDAGSTAASDAIARLTVRLSI